jgi:cell division septal protein FtsQ
VVISEREPLAIGRIGDGLYLIDRLGTRIDEFGPNYAGFDLPIVDGLAAAPGRNGTLVDERRAALAGRMLADIQTRPDIARLVSQIDVSDERDVVVILEGDSARVRLGDSHFVERLQTYFDLAQALRERVPDIDYVDLRFNERIYVRPLKASAAASAKADGPRTRAEGLRP